MNFAISGLPKKKMNLTIGVRSRRRVVPWVQVWVFWVEYRFGSVGSGLNIELGGLTRGFNREL